MASAPAGYALGAFRRLAAGREPGDVFTGLVRGDRVRDVSALGTVSDLLADWESAKHRLGDLANDDASDWIDLAALDVRCPVNPGQLLQCGANYRKHVVDVVMAERLADESITGHNSDTPASEVRKWAEDMMDDRAKTGSPYVFAGLPSALTGPYDEIVLPERGINHDWELKLAAVIGKPARPLTREKLGTDYPFDMGVTDPVERAAAAGLPAADLTAILSGNATTLFAIPNPAPKR